MALVCRSNVGGLGCKLVEKVLGKLVCLKVNCPFVGFLNFFYFFEFQKGDIFGYY